MIKFSKSYIVVAHSVGLADHTSNGDVCLTDPQKCWLREEVQHTENYQFLQLVLEEKETGECFSGFCCWQGGKLFCRML